MGRVTKLKGVVYWAIRAFAFGALFAGLWYTARLLGYTTSRWEFVGIIAACLLGDWLRGFSVAR